MTPRQYADRRFLTMLGRGLIGAYLWGIGFDFLQRGGEARLNPFDWQGAEIAAGIFLLAWCAMWWVTRDD